MFLNYFSSARGAVAFAVASRLALLALAAAAAAVAPAFDDGGALLHEEINRKHMEECNSRLDLLVYQYIAGPLSAWDGQHFVQVAAVAAQHRQLAAETSRAFFPLYPLLIYYFSLPIQWIISPFTCLSRATSLELAGVLISFVAFVAAARCLFYLSYRLAIDSQRTHSKKTDIDSNEGRRGQVERARRYAAAAVAAFCTSPASPHLVAAYTESLFCLLSFLYFYQWYIDYYIESKVSSRCRLVVRCVLTAAATATRSNGCLLLLFPLLLFISRARKSQSVSNFIGFSLFPALLEAASGLAPLLLTQWDAYNDYCRRPRPLADFCSLSLPLHYSYIQHKYWDQGFLRFYKLKNVPFIMLGVPAVAMCVYALARQRHASPTPQFTLKLLSYTRCSIFLLYWLILVMIGVLTMHVQVITRFVAASPAVYWAVADTITQSSSSSLSSSSSSSTSPTRYALILKIYFISYAIIGTIAFSRFYPWV